MSMIERVDRQIYLFDKRKHYVWWLKFLRDVRAELVQHESQLALAAKEIFELEKHGCPVARDRDLRCPHPGNTCDNSDKQVQQCWIKYIKAGG